VSKFKGLVKSALSVLAVAMLIATACSSDQSPPSPGEAAAPGEAVDAGEATDAGEAVDAVDAVDAGEADEPTDTVREAMEALGLSQLADGMTDEELIAESEAFCQTASDADDAPLGLDILQAEILQYAALHDVHSDLSASFVGVLLAAFCPSEVLDEVREAMGTARLSQLAEGMTDDELIAEGQTFCQIASEADDVADLEASITDYASSHDLGLDLAATFVGVLLATFCPIEMGRLGLLG
jgi:hypothetical protein